MRIITKGLIVREQHTGENDRIITVLTRDKGVVRAFATGARRIQHKNSVGTQLLCYSDLALFRGKDSYRVDEAVPIEVFFDSVCARQEKLIKHFLPFIFLS